MKHLDFHCDTLKAFYDTPLGAYAQRSIKNKIKKMWPDMAGLSSLGIGYEAPFSSVIKEASPTYHFALMPDRFACAHTTLTDVMEPTALVMPDDLPLDTASVDRIMAIHYLEEVASPSEALSELWRVLSGQGRLLLIVPNRSGFWTKAEHTPFGHGRPFSMAQLRRMLAEHDFTIERVDHALFRPPFPRIWSNKFLHYCDRLGKRFVPALGGVLIVEVKKQLYGGMVVGREQKVRPFKEKRGFTPSPAKSLRIRR